MIMDGSDERAGRVRNAGRLTPSGGRIGALIASAGPRRLLDMAERKLVHGRLTLRLPDGRERTFVGDDTGPDAVLDIHRWRTARRLMLGGGVGFARAYFDGDWDSPDVVKVIELAALNRHTMAGDLRGAPLLRALAHVRHALRANSRGGSRRNISFHYDLGNDFYRHWLDPSMTYSSAIFAPGDNSLESAQRRKYRRLLDLLDARPDDHILEIGCGWGGFAELAAKERGARVTGITLSREQHDYACRRIAEAGLADRVSIQLCDYRDVAGRFDHVASIEMFEAVGERYWQPFFSKIRDVLSPGGRAALQIITIDHELFPHYRRGADFIQTYIFPGGMLPSLKVLQREVGRVGLVWREAAGFGQHYARTLGEWRGRFEDAWRRRVLPSGFDELFHRIWTYYLAYCEGGFRGGSIDVVQVGLARD